MSQNSECLGSVVPLAMYQDQFWDQFFWDCYWNMLWDKISKVLLVHKIFETNTETFFRTKSYETNTDTFLRPKLSRPIPRFFRPKFLRPIQTTFFLDQIFSRPILWLFFRLKFFRTDTKTFFQDQIFPDQYRYSKKKWEKSRYQEVSRWYVTLWV